MTIRGHLCLTIWQKSLLSSLLQAFDAFAGGFRCVWTEQVGRLDRAFDAFAWGSCMVCYGLRTFFVGEKYFFC